MRVEWNDLICSSIECGSELINCRSAFATIVFTFFTVGCASTGVTILEEDRVGEGVDARGPVIAAEMEAVAAALGGGVENLQADNRGVIAVLGDEVVSYGVEPVERVWSHQAPGTVLDAVVGWDGESLLVRHRADAVPWEQERVVFLRAQDGEVLASHASVGTPRALADGAWISTTENGRVVANDVSTGNRLWQYDASGVCPSGPGEDVDVIADKFTVLVSHGCRRSGDAHLVELRVDNGKVTREVSWEGSSPELHAVLPHTVNGGPDDAVARMFATETSGDFLFLDTREFTPVLPEPWRDADIASYLDPPATDFAEAPTDIVVGDVAEMNDLLTVRVVRALALDEDAPFSREDLDDSLLIDGELVQSPYQWRSGMSGYMSALSAALAEAFPPEK